MSLKDRVRALTPTFILNWNRRRKKKLRNKTLVEQKQSGNSLTTAAILADIEQIGIRTGDTVLVHSALSRIGYLEEGPKTMVDALLKAVGPEGHVLMPTSPNHVYQLNYIQNTPNFDVRNSPSKTGKITEYFRTLPQAKRSIHPTEPVSVIGPNADYFIAGHFKALTPYTKESPFYKVGAAKGKILYIGVTLDMAGTSLHTLEDAVPDFKFPVYYPKVFDFEVIYYEGKKHMVQTKVHDPVYSKQRKCDELIPQFIGAGVMSKVKIGEADTLMVDAAGFFEKMLDWYHNKGVTMYTPNGS